MKRLAFALLLVAACGPRAERRIDVKHLRSDAPDGAPSDCADDNREDDDSIAQVLGKIVPTRPVTIADEVSCPADDDFFHVYANEGDSFGALVTWRAEDGELKVDLLDEQGQIIRLSADTDVAERAPGKVDLLRAGVQGDHYIRVRNLAGVRVQYSIVIR